MEAPAHGTLKISNKDYHGSIAKFACNDGFKLDGTATITCDAVSADTPWPTPPTCTSVWVEITTAASKSKDVTNGETPDTWVPLAKTLPSLILRKIDGVLTLKKGDSVLGTVKDTPKFFDLKLKTWKPLNKLMPELIASDIQAKVGVSPPDTVSVSASAKGETVEVLPKVLSFDDFSLKLDAKGSPTAEKGSVQLKGVARVGGKNGLKADVDTFVDLTASSASIPLTHKGGWSPIKGVTSPAIKAHLKLGVDNKHISLTAKASLSSESVIVPNLLAFVKHPTLGNPSIAVSLEKATIDSDTKYSMQLKTGLRLGKAGASSLPVLGITGEVSPTGGVHSDFDTVGVWNPSAVLPGLKTSGIAGNVTLDPNGKVSAFAKFVKPVSWTVSDGFELANWTAVATFEKSDLVAQVQGKIKIGSGTGMNKLQRKLKNDLLLDVHGDITNDKISLNVNLEEAWQPFNFSFATPKMNGKVTIGGGSFFNVSLSGMMRDKIVLVPQVDITLESEGEDATGPTFDINIKKENKDSGLEIKSTFSAKLCIPLIQDSSNKRCLPIKMKPLANPSEYSIVGEFTQGDFNPFAKLTDRVNIHASKESPLTITLSANLASKQVGLALKGKMDLDVPLLGKFEDIPIDTGGKFAKNGPSPFVLMTAIEGIKLPVFGDLGPVALTASMHKVPKMYIPGIDEKMDVKDITIFWRANSPIPKICNSHLLFSLNSGWNPFLPKLTGKVVCPKDNVFFNNTIRSIKFMRLSAITITTKIHVLENSMTTAFTVGASLQIATGSADCSEDSKSSQCLFATITAGVHFVKAKPPLPSSTGLDFDVGFTGAWLEPMGLRNFALVSPYLGIGVSWISGAPAPVVTRLRYDVKILWKRPRPQGEKQVVPTFPNMSHVYSHLPRIYAMTYNATRYLHAYQQSFCHFACACVRVCV